MRHNESYTQTQLTINFITFNKKHHTDEIGFIIKSLIYNGG